MAMEDGIISCTHCGARNRLKAPPAGQVPICGKCRSPLPWLAAASDASFGAEISASVPVLVDFWAEWCGPCRAMAPVLVELAREMAGKLKVVKLNVDENPAVAQHYTIRSIPTLMVFKDGRAVDTLVGALPKQALLQRLAPHLPS